MRRPLTTLDLEIGDGEFVSLLGPSGCGKTTTLRLLAGFLQPDAGEIRVDGKVVSSAVAARAAGAAQHVDDLSELRRLAAHDRGAKRRLRTQVQKTLEAGDRRESDQAPRRRPSGGVEGPLFGRAFGRAAAAGRAGARAWSSSRRFLLMDEPLSNLDANLREEMRFEIRRLHEEFKITTVYVTHDQAEAMATSERIAVLDRGRLVQVGTPMEIFDRPKTRFVAEFVGKANILTGRMDGDGRLLLADGVKIRLNGAAVPTPSGEVSDLPAPAQHHARSRPSRSAASRRSGLQSFLRYDPAFYLFRRRRRLHRSTPVARVFTRYRAAIAALRGRPVDPCRRASRSLRRRSAGLVVAERLACEGCHGRVPPALLQSRNFTIAEPPERLAK